MQNFGQDSSWPVHRQFRFFAQCGHPVKQLSPGYRDFCPYPRLGGMIFSERSRNRFLIKLSGSFVWNKVARQFKIIAPCAV